MRLSHFVNTFMLLMLLSGSLHAQWSTDPYGGVLIGYGQFPQLCSDSGGGCYISYEQGLFESRHIALTRLNRYGYKPWEWGNRQIVGEWPAQSSAKIVEDKQGGVIVAFQDRGESGNVRRIRVQRVDSSGNFLWGKNGIRVTLSETNQEQEQLISDGRGGCIVGWFDTLNIFRINRIESSGNRMWGDSGLASGASSSHWVLFAADGLGGCAYAAGWALTIRDSSGNIRWSYTATNGIGAMKFGLDTAGNCYLFGRRYIRYVPDNMLWTINLWKVGPSGHLLWDTLGIVLDTEKTNNPFPNYFMNVHPDGYMQLAWGNNTPGIQTSFMQNLFSDGRRQSVANQAIGFGASHKGIIGLIPSDSGRTIYTWCEDRDGYNDFWAQKYDTAGIAYWDSADVPITQNGFSDCTVTTDGANGLIGVWFVQATFGIYAGKVSVNGNRGEVITGINDKGRTPLPGVFALGQNYPNPFNPQTTISYVLPKHDAITLKVYDMLGREASTLFQGDQTPGEHAVTFNVQNYSSGVYIVRLTAQHSGSLTRKILLLK